MSFVILMLMLDLLRFDGQAWAQVGQALFLLKNRFLALVLPNLNRSG